MPVASEIARSADAPPASTPTRTRRVAVIRRGPGRVARSCRLPIAGELDLEGELDPVPPGDLVAHEVGQLPDVGRRPGLVVDDEVRVLLAHDRAADPPPLQAGGLDELAGRD